MEAPVTSCRRCGREMAGGAGDDFCPECSTRGAIDLDSNAQTQPISPDRNRAAPAEITRTSAPSDSTQDWTAPSELGPVRLVQQIGRGASGVVYRGYDRVLGRPVAVKFLSGIAISGSDRRQAFIQEARAAAAVRHPNLVQIHQAALAGDVPYLVLEYVSGVNLATILRQCGPLPIGQVLAILAEASAGVAALHQRELLHRDLKPANLMLDGEGHVRVTDLGLALQRPATSGILTPGALAGTPAYMAPEMFDGRVSVRSDVYALGITAFQLLVGSIPFDGTLLELRAKHERDPLPSAKLVDREISPAVVEVIERATHKQPLYRYKSTAEFAKALALAAGKIEMEKCHRELSLRVAHCSVAGAAATTRPAEASPAPSSGAGGLQQMLEIKRQRRTADAPPPEPLPVVVPPLELPAPSEGTFAGFGDPESAGNDPPIIAPRPQTAGPGDQIVSTILTLVVSLSTGTFCGWAMRLATPRLPILMDIIIGGIAAAAVYFMTRRATRP